MAVTYLDPRIQIGGAKQDSDQILFGRGYAKPAPAPAAPTMAQLYPKYYKPVGTLTEIDVYAVHKLFGINDPSGAIHHASKKLLLAGQRTGEKSMHKDIREARDTLDRWMQLNPESA